MVLAIWVVPLVLAALVLAVVALASFGAGSESSTNGWSFAPDGLRVSGVAILALGGLAAVWIGVGNHQLRSVLSGRAPFDWADACAVGVASALIGGGLLLADWSLRRPRPLVAHPAEIAPSPDRRQSR